MSEENQRSIRRKEEEARQIIAESVIMKKMVEINSIILNEACSHAVHQQRHQLQQTLQPESDFDLQIISLTSNHL